MVMNRFISISLIFLLLILSVIAAFYFWAGSPNLKIQQYAQVKSYPTGSSLPGQDTLSIISFNIGYLSGMNNNMPVRPDEEFFRNNLDHAIEIFREKSPVFMGFQEIDYRSKRSFDMNQMDSIADHTGFTFGAYVVNWDKRYVPFPYWPIRYHFGKLISGQGILSKFPILSNKRIVMPKPEGNPFFYNAFYLDRLIQVVEIDVQGSALILINVHLEAFDQHTREIQANIVREVAARYIDDYPLILFGDFNSRPPFPQVQNNKESTIRTIRSISGIQMTVSEEAYAYDPQKYYTFDSRDPSEMIDYIFYNDKIVPIEFKVLHDSCEISDHLPVFFKFIIKKN
jgi:endonuclease/exonuclease/phosphatase family metal-dependent hydrolase